MRDHWTVTVAWRRKCRYSKNYIFNIILYVLIYFSPTDSVGSSDYAGRMSNAWTHFRNEFLATHKEKNHTNIGRQTLIFRGTTTTLTWPQSFRFLHVGPFKTSGVFRCNKKWRDNPQTHFWCLSNHSILLPVPLNKYFASIFRMIVITKKGN